MNKVQKTLLVEAINHIDTDPVYAQELLNEVIGDTEWQEREKAAKEKEELKKYGIKELIGGHLSNLKEDYPWLLKAKIKDAIIELKMLRNYNNFIWKSGTWIDGVWEMGDWEDGTWLNGTWEKGEWADGKWKDGVWKKKGIWNTGQIWNKETKKYEVSSEPPK